MGGEKEGATKPKRKADIMSPVVFHASLWGVGAFTCSEGTAIEVLARQRQSVGLNFEGQ